MCGIVGYIGTRQALPILLEGLRALEYRGYDSAGVAVSGQAGIRNAKAVGRVSNLEKKLRDGDFSGHLGISHTRWATHGTVTEENAHPHSDCEGKLWLVHNGIIENYRDLKRTLQEKGHCFSSETDTEILAHLVEEELKTHALFEDAVRFALAAARGTYGIVAMHQNEPEKLIACRNFSPMLVGIGSGEYIIASDASAVISSSRRVIYLEDGEMAVFTPQGYRVSDFQQNHREKTVELLEWSKEEAEKGGFAHFMLKEIHEMPEAVRNSVRGRTVFEEGNAKLGGLLSVEKELKQAERILIAACGTACLAGRIGEYIIEELAGIPVEVDVASEFRYRRQIWKPNDIFLAISQSGETADTLAALREAKRSGILSLGIVNAVGSSIARETGAGVYQHVGPEIGVASTKAFVSQVAILALLGIFLSRSRGALSVEKGKNIIKALLELPDLMEEVIAGEEKIRTLAQKYQRYENFLFLGRGYGYPAACEGALKLKEVSYAHAEGCSAGEMKHGPIAMIGPDFPTIAIALRGPLYEKMASNIEEIKARGGPVIAIASEEDRDIAGLADDVIEIPRTLDILSSMLAVVPLHLFAYHFGVLRGFDVDKPRNLAKSVTVE